MSNASKDVIDRVSERIRDYELRELSQTILGGKIYVGYIDSRIIAEMAIEEYLRIEAEAPKP